MESYELSDGSIPELGFGTYQLRDEDCVNAVMKALETGYTHIDTADIYGNESDVGDAIKKSDVDREELFLTTKVWRSNLSYRGVMETARQSLKKLDTDYLDLLLIHWPNEDAPYPEIFEAMKGLKKQGKVKNIGVSNFTITHLEKYIKVAEDAQVSIDVNQVEFHPLLFQKDLLDYCNEHDVRLTAYSPLARGDVLDNKVLNKIGDRYEKTPAQVSLRWILQKGCVAIPKSGRPERIDENFDIFDFTLDSDEIEEIDSIDVMERQIDPTFSEFDD